jgi:hypothetical protein
LSTTAIVILNWNGKHYLERFLRNLIDRSKQPGVKVVIADNGSTDGSQDWVTKNFPSITLIELGANYGFTGGYNRALRYVEADYYLLLNSDVEVTKGWVTPLIAALDDNPQIGICMPKIKSAFERDHFEYAGASGGYIDYLGYPFCRGRILSNIEKDTAQYNSDAEIFWASGAAFMIRASLYRELGGFDETFFAHMEEIDLCWRAKLHGWQVWVFPDSEVYHVGGGTLPNNSPKKLYLNYRNNLLMLYKNLPYRRLHITLLLRMVLDGLSALLYLLQGKREFVRSVWEAHSHFREMRREIVRDELYCNREVHGIYRGSIVLSFFISLKKLRFINIGADIK